MASTPVPVWVVLAAILGLAVGSFLNVVIHRAPLRMSLSHPGSHCPRCGTPIKPRHNVPVFGWLVLRGRCATCAAPISSRYPLVEAGTAVLFTVVTGLLAADHLALVPAALWLVAAALTAVMIVVDGARPSVRFVVVAAVVLVVLAGAGVAFG